MLAVRRMAAAGAAVAVAAGVLAVGAPSVSAAQTIDGCSSAIYHVLPGVEYAVDYSACPLDGPGGTDWAPSYSSGLYGPDPTWDNPDPRNIVTVTLAPASATDPYMGDAGWVFAAGVGPFPTDQVQLLITCDLDIDSTITSLGGDYDLFAATFPTISLCGGGIPDWLQQYGRGSSSDSCLTGWAPSWSQWPNDGRGGWVCTRSIPSLG